MVENDKVYSGEVIAFTAVANEYCAFAENAGSYDGMQILRFMQRILPMLYSRMIALPAFESRQENDLQRYVNEADWQIIHDNLIARLGEANDYLEVFNDAGGFDTETAAGSIAEDLSDIYQDLKDYLVSYGVGTSDIMGEAVWLCSENFRLYWGQKLLNALRAIHYALQHPEEAGLDSERQAKSAEDIDTSDWIISKRQHDQQSREDDNEL